MKGMFRSLALAATVLVATVTMPVQAQEASGVEQWTFQNVTFSSGGSLTGYFTVNAVTHALLTWSVTTSSGLATYYNGSSFQTIPVPGFTYDNSTSWSGTTNVVLDDPSGQPLWFMAGTAGTHGSPTLGVTLTGTSDPDRVIANANSGENWATADGHLAQRGFATGYLQRSVVSPVPEPSSVALMLVGLGVVGVAMRRSRRRSMPQAGGALLPA